MTHFAASASRHSRVVAVVERVTRLLDGVPIHAARAAASRWRRGRLLEFRHGEARELGYNHRAVYRRIQSASSAARDRRQSGARHRADDAGAAYAQPRDPGYGPRAARHDGSD
jgi:hypothetical protein